MSAFGNVLRKIGQAISHPIKTARHGFDPAPPRQQSSSRWDNSPSRRAVEEETARRMAGETVTTPEAERRWEDRQREHAERWQESPSREWVEERLPNEGEWVEDPSYQQGGDGYTEGGFNESAEDPQEDQVEDREAETLEAGPGDFDAMAEEMADYIIAEMDKHAVNPRTRTPAQKQVIVDTQERAIEEMMDMGELIDNPKAEDDPYGVEPKKLGPIQAYANGVSLEDIFKEYGYFQEDNEYPISETSFA